MNTKKSSSCDRSPNPAKDTADIFLTGGTVLNVYSGELLKMNVAINGKRIWYVGPSSDMVSEDTQVLDVGKRVLVPGYIDPHFHPYFIYNPVSFGEETCHLGTATFCQVFIACTFGF